MPRFAADILERLTVSWARGGTVSQRTFPQCIQPANLGDTIGVLSTIHRGPNRRGFILCGRC